MGMTLPFGAWRILEARKQGKRPADMILVSMVGKLPNELNPVVQVQDGVTHDWSWAVDLDLCFWTTPKEYSPKHILDAKKAKPRSIYLWDCANELGYDVSALPTIESIERHKSEWDWRVIADRWTAFQEKHFARGELVWS